MSPPFSAKSARQDQFSIAYVRAVAAASGCAVAIPETDNDKIDVTLSTRFAGTIISRPKIDLQVKCEASGSASGNTIPYSIDIETYDALRDPSTIVPRLLVVVLVPEDIQHWLDHSDSDMSLRHCGYWISLKDSVAISGKDTTTIHLPKENRFDPFQLQAMMEHVANGKDLRESLTLVRQIQ